MRALITGEKGFIGTNLPKSLVKHDIEFINLNDKNGRIAYPAKVNGNDEMCVHRISVREWARSFETLKIDMVIHNAAVVGTDFTSLATIVPAMSHVLARSLMSKSRFPFTICKPSV